MAGYCGYSKSNNAIEAESDYKLPRSTLCKRMGLKPDIVEDLIQTCEWHHTSKKYNCTDYYDARDCIKSRILRLLSKPRPNDEQLKFRQIVKKQLIREINYQRRFNSVARIEDHQKKSDRKKLLNSEFRGLALAGICNGKKTNNSSAAHLAFEIIAYGRTFRKRVPDYMIDHYKQKCPHLLALCLRACDFLRSNTDDDSKIVV